MNASTLVQKHWIDRDKLSPPDVIALEAALEQFRHIKGDLAMQP